MSYDLYLFRPADGQPLTEEDFLEHFADREHYEVDGTNAHYHNERTGVYFTFDFYSADADDDEEEIDEEDEDEEAPGWSRQPHLAFNMNYFRPHIFGLEAAQELEALVDLLELRVSDPQSDEMEDGEFSPMAFLDGWNNGNRFARQALSSIGVGSSSGNETFYLPSETIRQVWEWCYYHEELLEEFHYEGLDIFVPRIFYVRPEGSVQTLCIWPQGIPTAVPKVDLVLITREELMGIEPGGDPPHPDAHALVTWDQLCEMAPDFEVVDSEDDLPDYLLLGYEEAPQSLIDKVLSLPSFTGQLNGLSTDQVLDLELSSENSEEESDN